jgi:hypothetical protein
MGDKGGKSMEILKAPFSDGCSVRKGSHVSDVGPNSDMDGTDSQPMASREKEMSLNLKFLQFPSKSLADPNAIFCPLPEWPG